MPRIKIETPESYAFETNLEVRVTDLNYGNHLGNDKVLSYMQEARVQFFRSYNMSELDFWGTSLIQGDAAISYKSEGFLNDSIKIEIAVNDISNSSFDLVYTLTNKTTDKLLALAKTRMVCFDYDNRKVTSVPETFKTLFV